MSKSKPKVFVPRKGPEFCLIFKRKAGAHSHKNIKRNKTRQKFLRVQRALAEY